MMDLALAVGGNLSETMTTAMTSAFTGVKTDVLGVIESSLPIALGIMGTILAIRLGIKFFTRVTNKS